MHKLIIFLAVTLTIFEVEYKVLRERWSVCCRYSVIIESRNGHTITARKKAIVALRYLKNERKIEIT